MSFIYGPRQFYFTQCSQASQKFGHPWLRCLWDRFPLRSLGGTQSLNLENQPFDDPMKQFFKVWGIFDSAGILSIAYMEGWKGSKGKYYWLTDWQGNTSCITENWNESPNEGSLERCFARDHFCISYQPSPGEAVWLWVLFK